MEQFPEIPAQDMDDFFSVICIETIKQQLEKDPAALPVLKEKVRMDYERFCRTQSGRELAEYLLSL